MDYIDIAGIKCSRLVLGCMRIANKRIVDVESLFDKALDIGINMLDHADIYGGGHCEEIYGDIFSRRPSLRDDLVIQTKCGIKTSTMYDLTKEHIVRSVEGSLSRLRTDRIDILLLHRPDTLMRTEEVAAAFDELSSSGKVLKFGVSNFSAPQVDFLQAALKQKLVVNQLQMSPAYCPLIDSGFYVNTGADEACDRDGGALWYCRKNGITIQTYGSMQCSFTDDTGYYYAGAFTTDHAHKKYFALNGVLNGLAQKYDTTVEAMAIKWILHHPANMQAIVGTTLDKRLELYRNCCEAPMSDREWYDIYRSAGHKIP